MDRKQHWEKAYETNGVVGVSWYRLHLETSLRLIREAADSSAGVIDVGGGASTLVDDLLAAGYADVSVLDLSGAALSAAQIRLGDAASRVRWIQGDVTAPSVLSESRFSVWHDRAVFHFLTDPSDRARYVDNVRRSVIPNGTVVVATFAPDGPVRCSGLDVMRYDAKGLHHEFGEDFELVESVREVHKTPTDKSQSFVYCRCIMRALSASR